MIIDDAELVAAAKDGDHEAFEELVRRTYSETFTMARRLMSNDEDARDVTQEVYLRAWRGLGNFRGDAQFTTWLYRITANCANTHLKRRRRLRAEPLDEFHDPAEVRHDGQPAAAVEAADLLEQVSIAVGELPEKLRQVLVLRDVYGLQHDAIAEELGISVTAAKVRLHRARRKLHDVIYGPAAASDRAEGNAHAV